MLADQPGEALSRQQTLDGALATQIGTLIRRLNESNKNVETLRGQMGEIDKRLQTLGSDLSRTVAGELHYAARC